ncbi:MAG: branched-chain amino acid ABC transporter permease [Nocardiopsaceae bacterium]|nr:branched-chain amino acid ABC transporter permease [Nocardiopsaceae bacterium]
MGTLVSAVAFGVVLASVIAVAAMGFTIQFGLTNVFNLSFGAIMTVGAFAAYLAQVNGINAWYGLAVGGAAGAVLTLLIGRGLFRVYARRGAKLFEMVMVTLGLGLVINYAIQAISQNNVYQFAVLQSKPLRLGPAAITPTQAILVGIAVAVFAALEAMLRLTRTGKALRAMAAEPTLARSCGIRTGRVVIVTWLLSGFLCGMAGVVYIINTQSVGYATGENFLPLVVAAAILGGAGSPAGAVVAALAMGVVTEIVSAYGGPQYSTVAGFGILVLVLVARPGSVLGGQARETRLTL